MRTVNYSLAGENLNPPVSSYMRDMYQLPGLDYHHKLTSRVKRKLSGGGISADVIWGGKGEEKKGKNARQKGRKWKVKGKKEKNRK
jgi:hypothetical protein